MNSLELHKKAQLMGFDGDYYGTNDPLLQFNGGEMANWTNQKLKSFTVSITSTAGINKDVVLFAGLEYEKIFSSVSSEDENINISKETEKAILTDGTFWIATSGMQNRISATGSPSSIHALMSFIKYHPTFLHRMKIRSNSPSQFEQFIKINKINPFSNQEEQVIPLTQFSSVRDYRTDMMDFDIPMALDTLSQLSLGIPSGAQTDITFFFGPSLNTGKYLDYQANRVKETILMNGVDAVRTQQALKGIQAGKASVEAYKHRD